MSPVRRSPRLEKSKDAQEMGLQAKGGVKKKVGASKLGAKGKSRAYWNADLERTLVELLTDHNTAQHKGQNGWSTEVWNKMTMMFHQKHPHTDYTKGQIQDKEKELKREYKMLKEARQQSGVSWNEHRCMVEADDALWENLIITWPKIGKFCNNKSFPLFNALGELYDGQLAEGNYNFTSTEPAHQTPVEVSSVHVLDGIGETIHIPDDDTHGGMQQATLMDNVAGNIAAQPSVPAAPSTSIEQEPKKGRVDVASMMGAYIELKKQQIESKQADPINVNQYSIKNCIDRLSTMSVSKEERVKASKVFKNAENREIFLSFDMETALMWLQGEMD